MRMSQREEEIARLQAEREAYEARLPPQIRADIEFRRSRGFDVPYRPIPEAQMRVLEAAGPNATQAQIQWAYDMRNRAEEAAPPSPPSARPQRQGGETTRWPCQTRWAGCRLVSPPLARKSESPARQPRK